MLESVRVYKMYALGLDHAERVWLFVFTLHKIVDCINIFDSPSRGKHRGDVHCQHSDLIRQICQFSE